MSQSTVIDLPLFEPNIAQLTDVRGAEFLPWALYNLSGMPSEKFERLVETLDKDSIIGSGPDAIHLVRSAPISSLHPKSLRSALAAHISYCTTHVDKLDYFPFGFLAAHHGDCDGEGVFLVHVDFEEPFEVTGFCLSVHNVSAAANPLRDDDVGANEMRDLYGRSCTTSST